MLTKGGTYFALILLLFASGMGVVLSGYFSANEIVEIKIEESEEETEILLQMKESVEPVVKIDRLEEAMRFDFLNVQVSEALLKKPLKAKLIRLGYLFNYKGNLKVAGLRIFPENSTVKSIKRKEGAVLITLVRSSAAAYSRNRASATLLSPQAGRYAQVKLNLKKAPCLPVILTLAKQAEIDIEFCKFIPENISIELVANNPLDAILQIVAGFGGKCEQKDKSWLLTGVDL
jgi:hypothetical protein